VAAAPLRETFVAVLEHNGFAVSSAANVNDRFSATLPYDNQSETFDQSGIELIAKITKEMDLPRETASVRNDGEDENCAFSSAK
jgi:hypothetical protein